MSLSTAATRPAVAASPAGFLAERKMRGNPNPSPSTRFGGPRAPRQYRGGRRPQPFAQALGAELSEEDARTIVEVAIEQAKRGDATARQWLADRAEGKAVAREEHGEPGEFDALDDVDTATLRKALHVLQETR